MNRLTLLLTPLSLAALAVAGNYDPPAAEYKLIDADRELLRAKITAAKKALEPQRPMVAAEFVADIEIHTRAAEWAGIFGERWEIR